MPNVVLSSSFDNHDLNQGSCRPVAVSCSVFIPQGPVAVKVQVPNMQDKTEWKLSGQVLNFTVPLTDQVCTDAFIIPFPSSACAA